MNKSLFFLLFFSFSTSAFALFPTENDWTKHHLQGKVKSIKSKDEVTETLIQHLGYSMDDLAFGQLKGITKAAGDIKALAKELGVGTVTVTDLVKELEKPARDPRSEMPQPILRGDILEMKDLKEGMILKGTVRNVIDFGAFVDIGVHQDGLVHISQMSDKFIKHPLDVVSVGDIVTVKVMSVDLAKKRIQLTMKGIN